jgi:hypothetical protein
MLIVDRTPSVIVFDLVVNDNERHCGILPLLRADETERRGVGIILWPAPMEKADEDTTKRLGRRESRTTKCRLQRKATVPSAFSAIRECERTETDAE